jgi:hypothetical protein
MKITAKQFDDFEQDFLMKHLKNSDYRYGQAFLSTFEEVYNSIPVAERQRLWLERDTGMAKRHCLKWVTNEQ